MKFIRVKTHLNKILGVRQVGFSFINKRLIRPRQYLRSYINLYSPNTGKKIRTEIIFTVK